MQHSLLVAEYHLRSPYLIKPLQSVVAYDDASVEVVEVTAGEASAVQWHEGSQVRRYDGQYLQYHPFGAVHVLVGTHACAEAFHHLQAFEGIVLPLLHPFFVGGGTERARQLVEVESHEHVVDGLCSHLGYELVWVAVIEVAVVCRQLLFHGLVFVLGDEVASFDGLGQALYVQAFHRAGLNDVVALVVDDLVELLCRYAQQVAYLVGKRAVVPDVGHGHHELDVSATLTPHFFLCDIDAATVARDAFVANALVLAAVAFVVLRWAEDAFAEESIALGLVCAVVDGLGLHNLAVGLLQYLLRRGQADGYLGEVGLYLVFFLESHVDYFSLLILSVDLFECHAKPQSLQFVEQDVEGFGNARCWHRLSFDDGFVGLASACHVVRLDGEYLLQHV